MKEIESKYRLCSIRDFLALLNYLNLEDAQQRLENFYLDTEDEIMKSKMTMLRLRRGGDWKITLKGPDTPVDGVFEREETEFRIEPEQAERILNRGEAGELPDKLGIDSTKRLIVVAHSVVERHIMRHKDMEIAVDRVMLDDGYEYFELEVEGPSKTAVQEKITDLIETAGICASPSIEPKYAFALQHTK